MEIEQLVSKNLQDGVLNLENLKIGAEGAKKLAFIETMTEVTNLELGDNEIGNEGVEAICKLWKSF